jgi:hypothetical protein
MSQDTAERDETTINEIAGGADEVLAPRAAHRGDRRSLLKVGAAAIAGMMIPAVAGAQVRRKGPDSPEGRTPQPQGSIPRPAGIDPTLNWTSAPLRLARRITMGLNDAEAARATSMGYSQYLEYQLAADVISDTAVDTYVATTFPLLAGDVNTIYNADNGVLQNQISYAGMYRGAFSGRQLKERLVEFWSDHFNIAYSKVGYLKVIDDRDVIRANAMTTFPQLLKASAHSAAMLAYLDQNTSTKTSPNQNYAREIMELHTLGVNGGYTQTDVAELSRVLTGWTLAGRGTFSFNAAIHDYGAKTVIGTVIPAASSATGAAAQQEGETMLNVLAAHAAVFPDVGSDAGADRRSGGGVQLDRRRHQEDDANRAVTAEPHVGAGDVQAAVSHDRLVAAGARAERHGGKHRRHRRTDQCGRPVPVYLADARRLSDAARVLVGQHAAAVERVVVPKQPELGGEHPVRCDAVHDTGDAVGDRQSDRQVHLRRRADAAAA